MSLKRRDPAELWSRRLKRRKKIKNTRRMIRILLGTMVAGCFAVLFLMPIILTITNSFMSSSEIAANYGQVFATTDSGGKVFISSKVNLKFIPDMVSFSQYVTVLFKSPDYLLKFWNSVILVVPIVVFQLLVAAGASFKIPGKNQGIDFLCLYYFNADAVSGDSGSQLSGFGLAAYFRYQMGDLAAGNFLTVCGISSDEVHAANSGFRDGGGTD